MMDYVMIGMSALFLFCLMVYCVTRSVDNPLSCADRGEVYNFHYLQPLSGQYERYLAKVLSVRDMKSDIARLNSTSDYRRHDSVFHRTPTLVTCELPDGEIRNFYAERVKDCQRSVMGRILYSAGIAYMF